MSEFEVSPWAVEQADRVVWREPKLRDVIEIGLQATYTDEDGGARSASVRTTTIVVDAKDVKAGEKQADEIEAYMKRCIAIELTKAERRGAGARGSA